MRGGHDGPALDIGTSPPVATADPGERVGEEGRQRLDRGRVVLLRAARLAGLIAVE
jgi:hypothetical protein